MKKNRKAINFDLDTVEIKRLGLYPKGYKILGKAFKEQGFTHRQGSGYVSKKPLTNNEVQFRVRSIIKENLWLLNCVNKMDVTDIGPQHDLKPFINDIKYQVKSYNNILPNKTSSYTEKSLAEKDTELTDRIKRSEYGLEFDKLNSGKFEGDKTNADKRLIKILYFFSGGDVAQTGRLYKSSKLYNPDGNVSVQQLIAAEKQNLEGYKSISKNVNTKGNDNFSSR